MGIRDWFNQPSNLPIFQNFQKWLNLRKIFITSLTILFGLALGLLLLEITLRLLPVLLPLETYAQLPAKRWLAPVGQPRFLAEYRALWAEDAYLRERMKPGLDTVVHGNPEYPAWPIETDSLGLGQVGFRDTLPEGPPFALVLGDSFGFGVGVAQEDLWLEQLERETGLSFLNLSQVGASSLQEARIYTRYGRQLPHQVVFWLFFQNDFKDNLRFAQWLQPEADIPQAVRRPTHICQGVAHRLLKRYSLVYELPLYGLRACEYSALTPTPRYQDERLSLTFCLDHDICDSDVQERMLADGWPLTRQALLSTAAQAEQAGATLIILIVPSKEQVYEAQFREAAALAPDYDVDRLVEPLRDFCRAESLPCLDLTGPLRSAAQTDHQLYFPIDIHWNEAGHDVVAAAVADYLQQHQGFWPDELIESE